MKEKGNLSRCLSMKRRVGSSADTIKNSCAYRFTRAPTKNRS
jgi:hypothetical protein